MVPGSKPNQTNQTSNMKTNTKIINLTPHTVNETVTGEQFPPSGTVARVAATMTPQGDLNGIPLFTRQFGVVECLPEPVAGVIYIVSAIVADACPDRRDLVSPGELVRNADGQPTGCRGFVTRKA
jgi:hypothetical protein